MTTFPHHNLVGWTVGNKRWPYSGSHHDCWLTPWKGEVLAINDIRAWEGRGAFPSRTPTQEDVDAHVRYCLDFKLLKNVVPVLWTHDDFDSVIHWQTLDGLVEYDADLAEWKRERSASGERWERRHEAKSA